MLNCFITQLKKVKMVSSINKSIIEQMQAIFDNYTTNTNVVGLGMGKTIQLFSNVLTSDFTYVSSSNQTTHLLTGKKTADLQNISKVDVYFDSADYYDKNGHLIKGGGGALTKEKLLMSMAKQTVILVEKYKYRDTFKNIYVPVEIIKESCSYFFSILSEHNIDGKLRLVNNLSPFITDNSNFIVDTKFDIDFLKKCKEISGVVEHGYFDSHLGFIIEEL